MDLSPNFHSLLAFRQDGQTGDNAEEFGGFNRFRDVHGARKQGDMRPPAVALTALTRIEDRVKALSAGYHRIRPWYGWRLRPALWRFSPDAGHRVHAPRHAFAR